MIEISGWLLRHLEWNAVVDTLKHEMAHQLVDEYIGLRGTPHGEAFKFARKLLEIDDSRKIGVDELATFTGGEESIVTKIKKLLAKGSNDAVSEQEGEAFLEKAQELMLRYNIEIADLADSGQFYVQRPVTPIVKRWPLYYSVIGHLMVEHYNVQFIQYNTANGAYMEYFGEPANVDVAEYITHVILHQGDQLYRDFLKKYREMRGQILHEEGYVRRASKASFVTGLVSGYGQKLREQRESAISKVQNEIQKERKEAETRQCCEIILASSKILRDHFEQKYRPKSGTPRHAATGAGYVEGREAGRSLNVNPGIKGSGAGKMIAA